MNLNSCFNFVLVLLFTYFRFYSFRIKIGNITYYIKTRVPSPCFYYKAPCLNFDCLPLKKLQITQVVLNNKKKHNPATHLVQEVCIWIFLNLVFNFHLEFHQCKFRNLPWSFFSFWQVFSRQVKFSLLLE